jgi:hypothetical protein
MDSAPVRTQKAALAQPVEHLIRNEGVACSSHASGTISLRNSRENFRPPKGYATGGPSVADN